MIFTFVIPVAIALSIGIPFLLFYATNNSELEHPRESISIIAVGDSIGYNIQSEVLSHLTDFINDTDIFIFNLEGVLLDSNQVSGCKGFPEVQSILTSSSTFVEYMKLAPLTVANMANNHVLDCGAAGIEGTKRILSDRGILSVGAGQNLNEACEPLLVEVMDRRIAFVSYNFVITEAVSADTAKAGAASLDSCNHDYYRIRSDGADIIIASIHYGIWSGEVNQDQVRLVNKLFDSGVDIVIGHSPHIPQAVMVKDGKLAFFSLGNFIFRPDYTMPPLAHTTIFPRIDLYADRIDVTIYPIIIDDDGIPHIHKGSDIISRIANASEELNTFLDVRNNLGHISVSRK